MPFHVISEKELLKLDLKQPNIKIVFVNRRNSFKALKETVDQYNDFLRRFQHKDDPKPFALAGSHFEERYRHKIMRDSKALKELREIYQASKDKEVYLIRERDTPEIEVLLDICKRMGGNGVW